MSLILEALRKSEAERQRGRAPGLFVEQTPARARRSGHVPAWAWGSGLAVIALLLVFAWREWGRAEVPAQAAPAASTPPAPESRAPQTQSAPPATALPDASNPPPVAAAASTAAPTPAPATRANPPTAPGPSPPATAPVASAPLPSPAPDTPAPGAPIPQPLPFELPPSPAPPETAEPAVPTLSSLGAAERAQLPPLRLSMHVYAEEPAQRFVILDGQRLGEGASPSPGLVLEQIRRDGLVLSVNGQRLLLPRP
jgi:general secretion pathway protein B